MHGGTAVPKIHFFLKKHLKKNFTMIEKNRSRLHNALQIQGTRAKRERNSDKQSAVLFSRADTMLLVLLLECNHIDKGNLINSCEENAM